MKIIDNVHGRCWHKMDEIFSQPKVNLFFRLTCPFIFASSKDLVMGALYCRMVMDELNEYLYDAGLAGLSLNLYIQSLNANGMFLKLTGFNEKAGLLLKEACVMMKNMTLRNDSFTRIKEKYVRELNNYDVKETHSIAGDNRNRLLIGSPYFYHNYEKIRAVDNITCDDLRRFLHLLWKSPTYGECLIHGNIVKNEAAQLYEIIQKSLFSDSPPLSIQEFPEFRHIDFAEGKSYIQRDIGKNKDDDNSCTVFYLQIGKYSIEDYAKLKVFTQMTIQEAKTQLRTKEQLGYVVRSHMQYHTMFDTLGYQVMVLSSTHGSFALEERIDAFLKNFEKKLIEMDEEEFNTYLNTVIAQKLEKPLSLLDLTNRYWQEIANYKNMFDRNVHIIKVLQKITLQEIIKFYQKKIAPVSPHRRKLSIQIHSPKQNEEKIDIGNSILIQNSAKFKKSNLLHASGADPASSSTKEFVSCDENICARL